MNIQTLNHKNSIDSNFIERILIDIACIESGLLKENFADKKKRFFEFSELKRGIPLTIPFIPQILDTAEFFQLSVEDFSKIIFGKNSLNYIGTKLCYKTNFFVKNYKIKSDYKKKIKSFINEIYETKFQISELKEKFNYLGAFQTRNIPHLGHEKLLK